MPIYGALCSHEGTHGIIIQGPRFAVDISRQNGLIRRLSVGQTSWVNPDIPIPDLWVSPNIDPRGHEYWARYENHSRVAIQYADDEKVIVSSAGQFYRVSGETLPLRWSLQYEVQSDGIIRIAFSLDAESETAVRWVVASRGVLVPAPDSLLIFERGKDIDGFGLDTEVYELDSDEPINFTDETMPWFQLGTEHGSVDVVFSELSSGAIGWTDTSPFDGGDPLGRSYGGVAITEERDGIRWERYRVRNTLQWLSSETSIGESFSLALQPVREDQPEHNLISIHWEGPHQFVHGYTTPSLDEIESWASEGVELVIGGINWASGDYHKPANLDDAQEFITHCHRHGIKVLPYVTLHDLEYSSPASTTHDTEWRIEPIVEFNYRSHLMCTGASGWRDHWKASITRALDVLDVDGLYIDFWAGKLLCYNARHGCLGRQGRYNVESAGEMLAYAARALAKRRGNSLIVANTNILPLAMVNNWIDVRLVGEGRHIEQIGRKILRAFYNPARFGTSQLILVDQVEKLSPKTVAMGIATTSALAVRKRSPQRSREELLYWENYRGYLRRLIAGTNLIHTVRHSLRLPDSVFVDVYRTSSSLVFACANLQGTAYELTPDDLLDWVARFEVGQRPVIEIEIGQQSTAEGLVTEGRTWSEFALLRVPSQSWAVVTLKLGPTTLD